MNRPRSSLYLWFPIFWAFGAGCHDGTEPSNLSGAAGPAANIAVLPGSGPLTLDQEFAKLAGQTPGFGGLFYDSTGALTVYLTDPARRASAASMIGAFLDQHGANGAVAGNMRVRQGAYDYRDLLRWHEILSGSLDIPGITQRDIDESRNRIAIGVRDTATAQLVTKALRKLTVPTSAVVVELVAPTVLTATLRDRVRPVIGGLQLAFADAGQTFLCTLGYNVRRFSFGTRTIDSSQTYFVTNSHCTDAFGRVTGLTLGQPDLANPIGTEVYDPPLFTRAEMGNSGCPVNRKCRFSDAALIRYSSGVPLTFGRIALAGSNTAITGALTITSESSNLSLFVGRQIQKMGRTSGLSSGTVTNSCVIVTEYENVNGVPTDTGRDMLCQVQATYTTLPGDSGSPVFISSPYFGTNNVSILGVNWGTGYSVYGNPNSPVRATLSAFNWISQELANYWGSIYGLAAYNHS